VSRSWLLYLDDLIESAEKIGRLVSGRTFDSFTADEAVFDAVLFNLQVIGEAIKRLPPDARDSMPAACGSDPARLRDLIAHHYFAIDAEIIWQVATERIPPLLDEALQLREHTDLDSRI
jgi:uncharacterized protein with HEPN domain